MNNIASQKAALVQAQAASASRFYWIAGLTVVGAVSSFQSAAGLGISELVNAIFPSTSVHIGFAIFMAAIFSAFGYFARFGNVVIFIVGMSLYGLDTVLMGIFQDWISVLIHLFILYRLYSGVQYAIAHKKIIAAEEEQLRRDQFTNPSPGQF